MLQVWRVESKALIRVVLHPSQSWACTLFSENHSSKGPRRIGRCKFHTAGSPCQHHYQQQLVNVRGGIILRLSGQRYSPSRQSFCSFGFDPSQKATERRLLNDVIQKIDADRPAIVELIQENLGGGTFGTRTTTYGELRCTSRIIADSLFRAMEEDSMSDKQGTMDFPNMRVAYMVPPGSTHIAVKLGIWLAGGVAVPLCITHPPLEIEHVLNDAKPFALIADTAYEVELKDIASRHGVRMITTNNIVEVCGSKDITLPKIYSDSPATMFYTSGTTGKPKGVVHTHFSLSAQVEALQVAWKWTQEDRILHALPLYHVHGVVNALLCALSSGATVEMLPRFNALAVWKRLSRPMPQATIFMGVPTMYALLGSMWKEESETQQKEWTRACCKLRLFVCGSAALPLPLFKLWQTISDGKHKILERYGMTEFGMALSNPLCGERRPRSVGIPLPGISTRIVQRDKDGEVQVVKTLEESGELEIRSPGMFLEYFGLPDLTRHSFSEGWFLTGDVDMALSVGYIRILGRKSIDVIKTGGHKVFAPEIEDVLRDHESINECAVIGVNDRVWGEIVCAVIVSSGIRTDCLELNQLRNWAKKRLAPYKIPSKLCIVDELPHNAMGKVQKHHLKAMF